MPAPNQPGVILDVPVASDFSTARPAGGYRHSLGIPQETTSAVIRQRMMQWENDYDDPPLGTLLAGGWKGLNLRIVQDENFEDLGGGLSAFDRVWAAVPGNWSERVDVVKQYQAGQYTIYTSSYTDSFGQVHNTNTIQDVSVINWSATVAGDCNRTYFVKGSTPSLPTLAFISAQRFVNVNYITDYGTGFPQGNINPNNGGNSIRGFTDNKGYCFVAGQIEHYMGDIYCMKTIYAA